MKFYTSTENTGLVADPCGVSVGDVGLTYTSKDSVPFVVSKQGRVVFGERGTEHQDIEPQVGGLKNCMLRGRLWLTPGVLTVWECQPRRIGLMWVADEIKRRFGINPEDIRFFFEVTLRMLVVELPLSEYLRLNISGNQITWFRQEYARQQRLKNSKNNDFGAKMDAKNIWRHYEMVGENRKFKLHEQYSEGMRSFLITYRNGEEQVYNAPTMDAVFEAAKQAGVVLRSVEYVKIELFVLNHDTNEEEHLGYYVTPDCPEIKAAVFHEQISRMPNEELRWRAVRIGPNDPINEARLRRLVSESVDITLRGLGL